MYILSNKEGKFSRQENFFPSTLWANIQAEIGQIKTS